MNVVEMSKNLFSWIVFVEQFTCLTALQIGCLYRVETWLKVSVSNTVSAAISISSVKAEYILFVLFNDLCLSGKTGGCLTWWQCHSLSRWNSLTYRKTLCPFIILPPIWTKYTDYFLLHFNIIWMVLFFLFIFYFHYLIFIVTPLLCFYCSVTLPHFTFGVSITGTTSSITVAAKQGVRAIWNLDDSLDVRSTPSQTHTNFLLFRISHTEKLILSIPWVYFCLFILCIHLRTCTSLKLFYWMENKPALLAWV